MLDDILSPTLLFKHAGTSHAELENNVLGSDSCYASVVYASDIKDIGWGLKSDGFRKRGFNGGVELGTAYKYRDYTEFFLSMAVLNWEYELKGGDVYEGIAVRGNPTVTINIVPVAVSLRQYLPVIGRVYLFGQLGVGEGQSSKTMHIIQSMVSVTRLYFFAPKQLRALE